MTQFQFSVECMICGGVRVEMLAKNDLLIHSDVRSAHAEPGVQYDCGFVKLQRVQVYCGRTRQQTSKSGMPVVISVCFAFCF